MGWAEQKVIEILARGDRDICFYCHAPLTDDTRTIDHVIPRSKGGTNDLWNLCLSCVTCNNNKGDMDVSYFLSLLRGKGAKPKGYARPRTKRLYPVSEIARWDEGHEEVRERIASVKRSKRDPREHMVENP